MYIFYLNNIMYFCFQCYITYSYIYTYVDIYLYYIVNEVLESPLSPDDPDLARFSCPINIA